MKIKGYLNTTKEEVESKKFNIWIGVSLGNTYFTKEAIEQYIQWALKYTHEDVVVVIPDRIHAANLEALDHHRSKRGAFRKAFKMGDEKMEEVKDIIKKLPSDQQGLVKIARWHDITNSKYHDYRTEVLFEEFEKKGEFYDYVIGIVENNFKNRPRRLTDKELEKLAEYVLHEIPLFLNGAKHGGKKYLLSIYPGLGPIDYLFQGLQDGTLFPDLAKQLKITDKIALVEGYVE